MMDTGYLRALTAAEMVTATPAAKGVPVWRERGLVTADLLTTAFVDEVRRFATPTVVEHPFLLPAAPYRSVFGGYDNTYTHGEFVMRPDNLHINTAICRDAAVPGPVIAKGGLLRRLRRGATPLFRDRHIWPAVQANHLVDNGDASAVLDHWRQAVEAVIMAAGLPVLTVRPAAPVPYGRLCWLAVSCLPNGRPTVLATLYVLSDHYQRALGCSASVLDIGFTGKILAVTAMHHQDHRGLVLPSAIAPVQVGLISTPADRHAVTEWCDALDGLRVSAVEVADRDQARWRAEKRLHRGGTPLVLSAARHVLVRRLPLRREAVVGQPPAMALVAALRAHDSRLAARGAASLDRGLRRTGQLRFVCPECAPAASPSLFGWRVPALEGPCATCGKAARQALLSEAARFY